MFLNIAWRCALVRLNLRPAFWWRMGLVPQVNAAALDFVVAFLALEHGLRMARAGIPCRRWSRPLAVDRCIALTGGAGSRPRDGSAEHPVGDRESVGEGNGDA